MKAMRGATAACAATNGATLSRSASSDKSCNAAASWSSAAPEISSDRLRSACRRRRRAFPSSVSFELSRCALQLVNERRAAKPARCWRPRRASLCRRSCRPALRGRRAGVIVALRMDSIGHAHHLHVEQMAERPAGVIVRMLLRIVGRPELMIEQRIGNARVGLIHAYHDAAGGKGLLPGLVAALLAGKVQVATSESCCTSTCWRLSTLSNSTCGCSRRHWAG